MNHSVKKKSFVRRCIELAIKVLGFQLFSIILYVIPVMLVTGFAGDEQGSFELYWELVASVITQLIVCVLIYKPLWLAGEDHAADLRTGHERLYPLTGLWIGLGAMSPFLIGWFFYFIQCVFRVNLDLFEKVLFYGLYAWAVLPDVLSTYQIIESVVLRSFCWLPILAIIPLECHIAFTRGLKGLTVKRSRAKRREEKRALARSRI